MKKLLIVSSVVLVAIILAGCGAQKSNNNPITAIDQVATANSIAQDSQNANTVDSESNINNIVKMMNYQGTDPQDNQKLKDAIKKGMSDGKIQSEMDKVLITNSAKGGNIYGTGYMLGYTFGCNAVTKNETKCSDDISKKYQEILVESFQNMTSTVPQQ
ncbi:MAG: hypothetical protein WC244_04165 [Patescibacteria group bacterium]|jgi:hypothetical protein